MIAFGNNSCGSLSETTLILSRKNLPKLIYFWSLITEDQSALINDQTDQWSDIPRMRHQMSCFSLILALLLEHTFLFEIHVCLYLFIFVYICMYCSISACICLYLSIFLSVLQPVPHTEKLPFVMGLRKMIALTILPHNSSHSWYVNLIIMVI